MAMGDRGLALPRELPVCFPEPSDFSADAFHNRSTHKESIHDARPDASGVGGLSPLSTGACLGSVDRTGPSLGGQYRYTVGIIATLWESR
jgi:hypothetical protein